jgi:hypothetical protein
MSEIETTPQSYQLGYTKGFNDAVNVICRFLDEDLSNTTDRDGRPSLESITCWTKEELINSIKEALQ